MSLWNDISDNEGVQGLIGKLTIYTFYTIIIIKALRSVESYNSPYDYLPTIMCVQHMYIYVLAWSVYDGQYAGNDCLDTSTVEYHWMHGISIRSMDPSELCF